MCSLPKSGLKLSLPQTQKKPRANFYDRSTANIPDQARRTKPNKFSPNLLIPRTSRPRVPSRHRYPRHAKTKSPQKRAESIPRHYTLSRFSIPPPRVSHRWPFNEKTLLDLSSQDMRWAMGGGKSVRPDLLFIPSRQSQSSKGERRRKFRYFGSDSNRRQRRVSSRRSFM